MTHKSYESESARMRKQNGAAIESHSRPNVDDTPPFTMIEVARRLGKSPDWCREFFSTYPGRMLIVRPKKRGVRKYDAVLLPRDVFQRFLDEISAA